MATHDMERISATDRLRGVGRNTASISWRISRDVCQCRRALRASSTKNRAASADRVGSGHTVVAVMVNDDRQILVVALVGDLIDRST